MESAIEECERAPSRLFVRVVFTHQRLDLLSNQSADGGVSFGGEHLRSSHRSLVESDRDVLTRGLCCGHVGALLHVLYVQHVIHVETAGLERRLLDPRRAYAAGLFAGAETPVGPAAIAARGAQTGTRTVNEDPRPNSLCTAMTPPNIAHSC